MRFRSLYSRIALTFAALILLFGGLCGGLDLVAAKNHQQEIVQRISHGLAAHIAEQWPLFKGGRVDHKAATELFHMLMVVNPSVEFYLLDAGGAILAYDAPPGKVQLKQVTLEPIRAFLAGSHLPLQGDNPRNPGTREIFSTAPISERGETVGYLYIVLSGDDYRRLAADVWQGHVFQIALWVGAGALLLTLGVGLGLFSAITRRLDVLTRTVTAFDDADLAGSLRFDRPVRESEDEIGRLAGAFTRMAERIAVQMGQIRSQDEQRREMVANVSHDLRTPLTSMQGYLETLLRKSDQLSADEKQRYLEVAVRQSRRVAHLAQELFELAKLECEEVRPAVEGFSLPELIQDVIQKFELRARGQRIHMNASWRQEGIPLVYGDIGMIERVLSNLIDNALHHTPEGGEVRIELAANRPNDVIVRVSDSGSGIAEEHLASLFDRHSPLRRTPGRVRGGLGLLITQRILQLHGSTIEVLSGQGRGAMFTFKLPTTAPA
ncbi:HAMP domain-containing sensor histidine kinase [Methylococcus sp. EFPC2]|uniref:sensor histidine kinase n=1 Tax=Methylococcus sp. EFPC2 TaxID=2812648 RepID=UPI0019678B84|nr:HAMP domain-containing sensor histidine kinase [Methylococcus sp. EFPC2]QSA96538.1 HAMP domain-containing histidine kinase [Methylococcus sp. EFPC2]